MDILVNGAQAPISPRPDETLGQLFERLNMHFDAEKLAVVGLRLNGAPVDLAGQESLWDTPCASHAKLELEALPHAELSRRTLADLKDLLTKCPGACLEAASLFQTGASQDALSKLDNIFQVWAVLFQSLSDAAKFHSFRLNDIVISGQALPAFLAALSEMIRRMQEAVKARDYVTVADLLEYDMAEAVPSWLMALDSVLERVNRPLHEPS